MKKIVVIIITIFPIFSYANRWVEVTSSSDARYYVDTQSIQKSGNSVTFWEKSNKNKRDEFGDLSAKANSVINCRTRETKILYLMTYDDFDNNGKLTASISPTKAEWKPIAPETISEFIMKFVCSR
jgi:hypothetical protein